MEGLPNDPAGLLAQAQVLGADYLEAKGLRVELSIWKQALTLDQGDQSIKLEARAD